LAIGAELDSVIYLATRYFGMRNYGALFGFIAALISAGTGIGPFAGGLVFDLTGSYTFFLMAVIPVAALSSLAAGTLGAYPVHE
jgi:MFS family permease